MCAASPIPNALGPVLRVHGSRLFGFRSWVALTKHMQEVVPAFVHHPGAILPMLDADSVRLRFIAGRTGAGAPRSAACPATRPS